MTRRWLLVLLLTAACAAACTGPHVPPATMTVSAPRLLDLPADVRLSGLGAGQRVTVTSSATDGRGVHWSAHVEFTADRNGAVSLGARPADGDYSTADPMGLIESMRPDDPDEAIFADPIGWDVALTATVRGHTVATGTLRRLRPDQAGVTSTDLRPDPDGVYGTLFTPPANKSAAPASAVLVFGGSEGGLSNPVVNAASDLAAHGHPALALAYFGEPGLPPDLDRIRLEYFARALAILHARPGVDPHRVYVMGDSRGGEGALLVAATYPDLVGGVVAQVPGSTVNAGLSGGHPLAHSAWSRRGQEVPYTASFGVSAADVDPAAVIPVERIRGPVLLTCGGLDAEWPSCRNVADVTGRLHAHGFRFAVTALTYPDAGHFASSLPPYTAYGQQDVAAAGGDVAATQRSNADFWAHLLTWLDAEPQPR